MHWISVHCSVIMLLPLFSKLQNFNKNYKLGLFSFMQTKNFIHYFWKIIEQGVPLQVQEDSAGDRQFRIYFDIGTGYFVSKKLNWKKKCLIISCFIHKKLNQKPSIIVFIVMHISFLDNFILFVVIGSMNKQTLIVVNLVIL